MNSTDFNTLLQQPESLKASDVEALESITKTFPYFQSAKALYLKALKNADSFKYNNALKVTAAYTTDRSILFDFITSKTFTQNKISKAIKQNTAYINSITVEAEDISVINRVEPIDDNLDAQIKASKDVLKSDLFQPKTALEKLAYFKPESSTKNEIKEDPNIENTNTEVNLNQSAKTKKETELKAKPTPFSAKAQLNVGKPLEFGNSETHSFNEWLSLTALKPINRKFEVSKPNTDVAPTTKLTQKKPKEAELPDLESAKKRKFELIDRFIINNPKIKPNQSATSKHNIVKERTTPPEALMTETLARIYVEQKNYKKAIQSYKILSLKYPEKSGFFADQIKAIKELQENNN